MTITNVGMIHLNEVQDYLANMAVDTELRFTVQKHGYETTFWIQRTQGGWREQNSLYGLQEGFYSQWFARFDSFESEIHSILDK